MATSDSVAGPSTAVDPAVDHTPAGSKTCTVCGRVFKKAAHLQRHLRSHNKQKPFECTICGRAFARTDALQRHERWLHSKRRRTDDLAETGSSDEAQDGGEQSGQSTIVPSTSDPFSVNDIALPGPQDEQAQRMLIPPMSGFDHMMAGNVNDPLHTNDTLNGRDGSSFGGRHTCFPPPSFLTSFPTSSVPTDAAGFDEMIAEWLNQDGGALATENALAVVFSDLAQTEMGLMPTGLEGSYVQPQLEMPDTWERPRSSGSHSSQNQTNLSHSTQPQRPVSSCHQGVRIGGTTFSGPAPPQPPTNLVSQLRRRRPTVYTADTWESGVSNPPRSDYSISRPESPEPSKINSPEQVVSELHVNGLETSPDSRDRDGVIPSMKFLDACLHLYFRDFHPSFPIIHRPTFQRDRTSPLLLLSMCSIGCMFVGTQTARDSGLWIYERLHYVVVVTRDSKMASEDTRLAVTLSSLLGQCFSFLYGTPKHMLTAESFHGTLCTMARRNGLSQKIKRNPISFDVVEHLDSHRLTKRWQEWGRQETFRRVSLGLTIHAAELTAYSGLAQVITAQASNDDGFNDALFEANDAQTWRALLQNSLGVNTTPLSLSEPPEIFLPTVLLAQTIVKIYMLRELEKMPFQTDLPLRKLSDFYDYMLTVANDNGNLPSLQRPRRVEAPWYLRSLAALWHYTCVLRLAPMCLMEEVAGRGGSPSKESIAELQAWVKSPTARLATLHSGHVLSEAADLKDQGFLLPRAIFQATLLLLCYLSFAPLPPETNVIVDVLQVIDWNRLVELCDHMGNAGVVGVLGKPEERYIAYGTCTIQVKGFIDGREKQLDIVSLRSTSNRLLRRCTPWGIGDTLGDILSNISF